jgi:hypothetical protein
MRTAPRYRKEKKLLESLVKDLFCDTGHRFGPPTKQLK